jgi:hypothetical protein
VALNLLYLDGFDNIQFFALPLKYQNYSTPFIQGRILTGYKSVAAISIDNTAGSQVAFSRTVGAAPVMMVAGHFQVSALSQQTFLIIGTISGPVPLLQLEINTDGTMNLLDHAGSLLGQTTQSLSAATTYWIEVNAIYGTGGSYEVWLGLAGSSPTKVLSGSANLTSAIPDTVTFQWVSSGSPHSLWIDNLQIFSAAALTDRNGPAAVTGLIAQAIVSKGGWTFAGSHGTSLIQAIADNASYTELPDGALSYDVPGTGNLTVLVSPSPCFGLVLGVALNVVATPISSGVGMNIIANERTGAYVIGSASVVNTGTFPNIGDLDGYATYQAVAQLNSEGQNWNDLQISTAQWGIEAAAVFVTQIYLEKLTDLTGQKFGCGESSYSF